MSARINMGLAGLRRIMFGRLAFACICMAMTATAATATAVAERAAPAADRPASATVALPNFAALVRRVGPAVVNISVTREVTQWASSCRPALRPIIRSRRFSRGA